MIAKKIEELKFGDEVWIKATVWHGNPVTEWANSPSGKSVRLSPGANSTASFGNLWVRPNDTVLYVKEDEA